jgi:capsular polysaccharide biosynthesis protein
MNEMSNRLDDEIELIDYLRVIWKWKYLILGGTVVCALMTVVIGFSMPKVYRTDTVLQLSVVKIDKNGKKIYIDSPKKIKTMIQGGTFNSDIINNLKNVDSINMKDLSPFVVATPGNSNIVKISYESSNPDLGIKILNELNNLLLGEYREVVAYYKSDYDKQIQEVEYGASALKGKMRLLKSDIKSVQKRISELRAEILLIDHNTNLLTKQRAEIVANSSDNNLFSAFLYSNTIQQNIALKNTYKNEIYSYVIDREDKMLTLERLQEEMKIKAQEIEDMKEEKNDIQDIQVIQPPTSSPSVIKAKIKRKVMLAGAVGLFLSLFLAFFLEYIGKYKRGESR